MWFTLLQVWTATNWGDASGSHGAFETVDITAAGDALLLAGLANKPSKEEHAFKSFGNAPGGRATITKVPLAAVTSGTPTASDAAWTVGPIQTPGGFLESCKAVRGLPNGDVAALFFSEAEGNWNTALAVYSAAGARKFLIAIGQYGEGTDMVPTVDGSALYITGHDSGSDGVLSARLVKISAVDGSVVWSRTYRSVPVGSNVGYLNECWGVQATPDGGAILACGTGIEDCSAFSGQDRTDCRADRPVSGADTRPGAIPRAPAVWQSLAIRTNAAGELQWQRVDQYRRASAPQLGSPGWQAHSSASEFVAKTRDGGFMLTQDEQDGVGILKLIGGSGGGGETPSPTPPPSQPTPAPTPSPTPSPPSPPNGDEGCCQTLVPEYGFKYGRNRAVCAAARSAEMGCKPKIRFNQASNICESIGARLCTVQELRRKEAQGVGCGLNRKFAWTSNECTDRRGRAGYMVARTSNGKNQRCKSRNAKAAMVCCADRC